MRSKAVGLHRRTQHRLRHTVSVLRLLEVRRTLEKREAVWSPPGPVSLNGNIYLTLITPPWFKPVCVSCLEAHPGVLVWTKGWQKWTWSRRKWPNTSASSLWCRYVHNELHQRNIGNILGKDCNRIAWPNSIQLLRMNSKVCAKRIAGCYLCFFLSLRRCMSVIVVWDGFGGRVRISLVWRKDGKTFFPINIHSFLFCGNSVVVQYFQRKDSSCIIYFKQQCHSMWGKTVIRHPFTLVCTFYLYEIISWTNGCT